MSKGSSFGSPSSIKTKLWLLPLVLAVLANSNVLSNHFIWDDLIFLKEQLPGFRSLHDVFFPNLKIYQISGDYYRPLIILSYLWDRQLWNGNPFGFHLTVLLFHLGSTLLVFLLSLHLLRDHPQQTWVSVVSSSIFAVHPIHTENVAWMAGRSDTIPAFLMLLSMLCYAKYLEKRGEGFTNFHLLALSSLCLFLALLSKEVAISLLFLLPLYNHLTRRTQPAHGTQPLKIRFATYLLPFIAFLAYYLMRLTVLGSVMGGASWVDRSEEGFFLDTLMVFGFYLKKLLWPFDLQTFIPEIPNSSSHLVLSLLLLSFSILLFGWAYWKNQPVISFSIAWVFITLSPSILVAFTSVSKTPLAERYLYIPSFGFALLAGLLLVKLFELFPIRDGILRPLRSAIGILVIGAILGIGTWVTLNRNRVWNNNIAFWTDAVHKTSEYGLPHYNLGQAYVSAGRLDEAAEEFKLAIQLKYQNFGKSLASTSLGEIYRGRRQYDLAEQAHLNAIRFKPTNYYPYYYLGILYIDRADSMTNQDKQKRENLQKAVFYLKQSIDTNPFFPEGHYDLGRAYRRLGDQDEANKHLERVIEISPNPSSALALRAKRLLASSTESEPSP